MACQSPSSDGGLGEAVDQGGGGLGLRRRLDMKASGSGFHAAGKKGSRRATMLRREVAAGGPVVRLPLPGMPSSDLISPDFGPVG